MKITLVDNLLLQRENDNHRFILQPHLGLISLIAVLETQGYAARLYDPKIDLATGKIPVDENLYRHIADEILSNQPDVVGFTSLGCNFICTLKIARYIKQKRPLLPILLGGPHATVLHKEIISTYLEFDVIVRNEAEQKIIPVIEGLINNNLDSIEGITYRKNGTPFFTEGASIINDLETLPLPAYHAYPIEKYSLQSLRVEAGRGCPFACTFCSTATFFGRSYRLKSSEKLCNELDYLHHKYGITDFGLTHDLFTVNKLKVAEFCREVAKRKYTWRCSARMDCVDIELLSLMKNAGCISIYYGIETGSQRMQKISKKKLDLEIFEATLKMTLDLGITPTLSFIVGYPEEKMEDVEDTLNMLGACLLMEHTTNMHLQLHLLTPEPGTALHNTYKDQMGYDDYITDFNFPTLEKDDTEIMERHPDIFMNHHYYLSVLPRSFFIITESLFVCLQALGKTIIRYLLFQYENSLPKLNQDVYAWCLRNSVKSMNNHLLLLYINNKFSHESVLNSLVRYQLETLDLLNSGIEQDEPSRAYTQSNDEKDPGFRLLKDIHDYNAIIQLLKAKKKIPKKLFAQRHDFVIHLFDHKKKGKTVECYELRNLAPDILKPIEEKVSSKTDQTLLNLLSQQASY